MTSAGTGEQRPAELTTSPDARQWGFIGSGKMATALIRGMLRSGVAGSATITASDPLEPARTGLAADTGIRVYETNAPVMERSDVIVLAVKPQTMPQVLAQIRPLVGPRHLVVSIAAGISIATLLEGLGPERKIVRVMPNTPALLGEGASAYALGPGVPASDEALVKSFLDSVGRAVRVPETMLDAVTGLSGSGPAFVYLMIDALSDGGVRVGLPRDIATLLAAQTVLGSADGPGNRVPSRCAQRPGDKSWRHHHRRAACPGAGRSSRRPDRCGRGSHEALGRAGSRFSPEKRTRTMRL